MKPFQYATAHSIATAVDLVADDGRFFAGGIDVLGELKDGLTAPDILVNVKALPETTAITPGDDLWHIGANVTLADLAAHPEVQVRFPGLAEAAAGVGSPQIRNVATVAGNLAQHSRCWYYRHKDIDCLKTGGETCYARRGNNRHHSLFSGNPCISPVVSNLAVVLAALGAEVLVYRGETTLRMSIPELYEMAWYNSQAHHSLRPADLILGVEIPTRATASTYQQVSEKGGFDWALVSCAAAARVEGNQLHQPRVVLGVVAPVPYQQEVVNQWLDGKTLTLSLAAEAAERLLADARPRAYNGYKVPLAQALVQRTLMRLVA
jgi:xanthine dehydrogenase YagS FAD-binding subunit